MKNPFSCLFLKHDDSTHFNVFITFAKCRYYCEVLFPCVFVDLVLETYFL